MHEQNIRVILWVTSMVNNDSSNYEEFIAKKYYVADSVLGHVDLKWWHGEISVAVPHETWKSDCSWDKGWGSLLDYTNPEAVAWWHAQMDPILALGIDGWKTDGTDPYILEYIQPLGYGGKIDYRQYADMYYGDFFNYTRQKNGDDRLIMSRPVDGEDPVRLGFL